MKTVNLFLPTNSNPNLFAPRETFSWYLTEAQRFAQLAGEAPALLTLEFWREETDLGDARYVDHRLVGASVTLAGGTVVDLKALLEDRIDKLDDEEATLFGEALFPEVFDASRDTLNEFVTLFGRDPSLPRETITLRVMPEALGSNLPNADPERAFVPLGPFGYVRWGQYAHAWHALAGATRQLVPNAVRTTVQAAIAPDDPGDPKGAHCSVRLDTWKATFENDEGHTVEVDLIEKVRSDRARFERFLGVTDVSLPGFWFGRALGAKTEPEEAGAHLHQVVQLLSGETSSCQHLTAATLDLGSPPEVQGGLNAGGPGLLPGAV